MSLKSTWVKGLANQIKWFNESSLAKFVMRVRERWPNFEVERVIQKRNKQILFVRVQGHRLKLIVYRDGRVRAYGPLQATAFALKRIAARVLGIE